MAMMASKGCEASVVEADMAVKSVVLPPSRSPADAVEE